MEKNKIINVLSEAGDAWLTFLLVCLALFLLWIAFFSHNIFTKAFAAAWVMFP